MRLLRVSSLTPGGDERLELEEFFEEFPAYAILSHVSPRRDGDNADTLIRRLHLRKTWSRNPQDEVLFNDIANNTARQKKAFQKLQHTANQAVTDGYEYVWIDTFCIDKSSSAELQEAINSMYKWYESAAACYAYLEDVEDITGFKTSRWFTRGWTLQELLAPPAITFFSSGWNFLGTIRRPMSTVSKLDWALIRSLTEATVISRKILTGHQKINCVSIETRMSWAAHRKTTRQEDMAYCLLGIFDVNMPLLYGEGRKAFLRLQEEIMRRSADSTIFIWTRPRLSGFPATGSSLLADEPFAFKGMSASDSGPDGWIEAPPFTMSSLGLQIRLPLVQIDPGNGLFLGVFTCRRKLTDTLPSNDPSAAKCAVYLERHSPNPNTNRYTRVFSQRAVLIPAISWPSIPQEGTNIFVHSANSVHAYAFFEGYVEDVKFLRINVAALHNDYPHLDGFRRTSSGWEPIDATRMEYERPAWYWQRWREFVLPIDASGPGKSVALRLRPFEATIKQVWLVFTRTSSEEIRVAALQQDADPKEPRQKFRISLSDVYYLSPESSARADSHESPTSDGSGTDDHCGFGYALTVEKVSSLDTADRQESERNAIEKFEPTWKRRQADQPGRKNPIREAIAAHSEHSLEEIALRRGCQTYGSFEEMLDPLTAQCKDPLEWSGYYERERMRRLCRCCISLKPATAYRHDRTHAPDCVEIVV